MKIYKDKKNGKFEGVCAGLAKAFNIDVTIIRLIWALVTVFPAGFFGIIVYVICAIIIPNEPDDIDVTGYYHKEDK